MGAQRKKANMDGRERERESEEGKESKEAEE